MEKRMIVAIALSLLVVLTFQYLGPKKQQPIQQISSPTEAAPIATGEVASPGTNMPSPPQTTTKKELTTIETDKYIMEFSNVGGSLNKLVLKSYLDKEKEEMLIDAADPTTAPFSMTTGLFAGLNSAPFTMKRYGDILEYTFVEPGLMEITKRYTFNNESNYIDLSISIKNISRKRLPFSYSIMGPTDISQASEVTGRSFVEADTMIDDKLWKTKSVKGKEERSGNVYWAGLKNRYFALVLKPYEPEQSAVVTEKSKGNLSVAINSNAVSLAPGETIKETYVFFAGPLDEGLITAIDPNIGQMVDYGFFGPVSKLLLKTLRFFHSIVKNWGIAIILLTVVINLLLFPLTKKSFASMQQMKKLQPHMQKLKEIHKDNPQKLNKEMMELYKQYKVNPLGGCLPLVLQMPIFIALYQGLVRSIELKGASFLWIKDLSKPDGVPIPFKLPVIGDSLNILPLLMVGMMVVQQKISQSASGAEMSPEQASQQKMMTVMFPLLFGFLFYKMPSGLVLYWLTNTILMTAEQGMISRQLNQD